MGLAALKSACSLAPRQIERCPSLLTERRRWWILPHPMSASRIGEGCPSPSFKKAYCFGLHQIQSTHRFLCHLSLKVLKTSQISSFLSELFCLARHFWPIYHLALTKLQCFSVDSLLAQQVCFLFWPNLISRVSFGRRQEEPGHFEPSSPQVAPLAAWKSSSVRVL